MMDMRQHGGGAMPSNTLQFSPQSTLSNDNLFLLDPNFSPSPSMDLCGPPFPSQVGSDFPSVYMDSSFQNAVMGSSMECLQGQALSADGFYAADEWSGTTNSTSGGSNSQPHHHNHQQDASSSQRQSSLAQNPVNQSVSLEQDGMVVQPLMNKDFHQGGEMVAGQGRLQGMVKQLSALTQGSLLPQQVLLQEERKNMDFQVDFYGHQRSNSEGTMSANLLADRLPHEDCFQEARQLQLHGLELLKQQEGLGSTPRAGLQGVHGQQEGLANTLRVGPQGVNDQQAPGQTPIYHDKEGDTSASSYHILNSGTLFQTGHGENATGQPTPGGAQIGQHNDQQGLQRVRSQLALQLQGRLSHSALQTPLTNQSQYLNHAATSLSAQQLVLNTQHTQGPCDQLGSLQSHSNSHQLSMLLQSQASAQFQSLSQAHAQAQAKVQVQAQAQAQAQSVNQQQAATNHQTVFQPRQLQQGGSQQSPLVHGSQQNTFQSMQLALATSQALPGTGHNLHVNGSSQEMMSQIQPRLLNPAFQGLKAAVPQVLQRFPSGPSLGFNNGQDGNSRTQMPSAIAARCIHVLMQYIQEQQNRPADNNIVFWRNLVNKFFVPGATKRWCLSSYNSSPMGRHAQGLFPMDCWFCNLCGVQPGRGFESGTDVLPRLFKIKYDSGLVDELLFLDIAEERYMLPNGRLVLEFPRAVHESIFPRAVHESVFPELRVVRYGRLRVTFSSYFKIYSWEFCTKIHEEVVPRKSLFQQAQQLAKLVMDCDQEAFDKSAANLKAYCNEFTATAKQLAGKLEAPSVNDLGFSKRYVRCLQIAEVVNSMKDLISFERKTGSGPINSLATFPSVRKVPEEQLTQSTSSQLINQQPSQGTISSSSSYLTLQQLRQAQINNSLQQGMVRGSDARSHLDMPTQVAAVQAQMPSVQQAQAQSANQLLNQLSARSISPIQGSSFRQAQPQMSPQVLGNQAVNFSQIAQQIYDAAGNRQQLLQQSCVPPAQSLNHTGGQQSLPGTPQSEMSDMRTNT